MIILEDEILKDIYGDSIPPLQNPKEDVYRSLLADKLKKSLNTGKVSKILFEQLLYLPSMGMRDSYEWILDEIAYLEGIKRETRTKEANRFRAEVLKGFYKKHFYIPAKHLANNILKNAGINSEKSTVFEDTARPVLKKYNYSENTKEKIWWKISGELAQKIVSISNDKTQTGDYLIYYPFNGINHYLCLNEHGQDEAIKELCKQCVIDFPFLQGLLNE